MLKHYVKFFFPGYWGSDSQIQEIAERKLGAFQVPYTAHAYQLLDREEAFIDGNLIIGNWENLSPCTYFGKEYAIEEVKAKFPEHTPFVTYMENNGWTRIVETRHGVWRPLEEEDIVINS